MTEPELLARIAALESAIGELRRDLADMKRPRIQSMRSTGRCPGCGGGRLLHFRNVPDLAHGGVKEMSLQKNFSTWWGLQSQGGVLETFACRTCRLVEWHATTLDDVRPDGKVVVELVAPEAPDAPRDPYR